MTLVAVPKILFNVWFWFALIAVIIVVHFFWGKTPAPKKPSKFFLKHQKAVTKTTDIFIIAVVLLLSIKILFSPVRLIYQALAESEPVRSVELRCTTASAMIMITVVTGFLGTFIGMLSVFQSKLTRTKRVVLLSVCIVPILFSVLSFFTHTSQKPIEIIWFCIKASSVSWIVNFPAILFGIHFLSVAQKILYKLKLIPEESFANKERD